MSDNTSTPTSRAGWTKVAALSDDEIDTSDSPSLDESFFARASVRMPKPPSEKEHVDLLRQR